MGIIIKRLIVVLLFLVSSIYIYNMAPEYELEYKYKDGDIRVIFNDVEITRNLSKLPQTALLVDGEIMLSQDTVDILFDKNLYYEQKHDILITTSKEHRADLKVNSRIVTIDDKSKNIPVPPIRVKYNYIDDNRYTTQSIEKRQSEEIIYIPIKSLEEVYDVTIEFKDKIIITENKKDRVRITVKENDYIELKHAEDSFSKNVEIVQAGKYIDIYNYDSQKSFLLARSYTGELGYVSNIELKEYEIIDVKLEEEDELIEKINIAWDYINPDTTNIIDKLKRKKEDALDVVAPTLLYLKNQKGDLQYNKNVVSSYINWANDEGYRVWVTLKNEYANKHFTLDETSEFLNDMNHRATAINGLIEFATIYKVDGINIDLEYIYQKDATALSQFIRELSVKAHKNNLVISVCVNVPDGSPNWSLCYQHKALSEYADYLAVMTYDQYGASSQVAGPNASLDWVTENIEKLVNRDKIPSEKILLGVAFYSRLWKSENSIVKPSTLFMSNAKSYLKKTPAPIWLEDAGQYFYENPSGSIQLWIEENESIVKKLELIEKYDLGGSAYWMLGYETEDIWSIIKEVLK